MLRCGERCLRELREKRLFCTEFWSEQAYAVMDVMVGSPLALLRLHRLLLLEAACSLVLLPLQAVVFLASFLGRTEARNMGMLLFIVAIPIIATALRIPLLVRLKNRCSQLALASELQNAAVATGMVQLLRSDSSRRVQIVSASLTLWYALGVSWNYIGKPCRDITEPIRFWEIKPESAPCECWEAICTLLLLANGALGALTLAAPSAVAAFQSRFLPSRSRGIPARALQQCLPEQIVGAEGAPGFAGGEGGPCSICLEPLLPGDAARRLPCGHGFHSGCADAWLTKSATCPMRCGLDLWELVRAELPDASAGPLLEGEAVDLLAAA